MLGTIVATSTGVSDMLTDVTTLFTSASNMITGNPIAAVFIGISLTAGGIGLFRKVIRR